MQALACDTKAGDAGCDPLQDKGVGQGVIDPAGCDIGTRRQLLRMAKRLPVLLKALQDRIILTRNLRVAALL